MREIKFRAWDDTLYHMFPAQTLKQLMDNSKPINYYQLTIMQYTGLKDKNGVEIYEGDIVGVDKDGAYWSVEWGVYGDTGYYVYNQLNSCRKLKPSDNGDFAEFQIYEGNTLECEVIGNIHQNPELIKK